MTRAVRWLLAPAVLTSLFILPCAWGDGKIFSAADDMREPNQKALLFLDGKRESLILQVKYEGGAGEFGWVVPVPRRPKVSTAPAKVFYELSMLTRPTIVHAPGAQSKGMGGGAGVTVVEQSEVGIYGVTVLAASEPEALAKWLREHGYKIPADAERVFASYVKRGWYYVAMRIDVSRLRDELLADLRKVDPEIRELDQAPERLAEVLLRQADEGERGGKVQALGKVLDAWRLRFTEGSASHRGGYGAEYLSAAYEEVRSAPGKLGGSWVVGQFESSSPTISSIDQTWSVTPAATAGVVFSVW